VEAVGAAQVEARAELVAAEIKTKLVAQILEEEEEDDNKEMTVLEPRADLAS
jgi:hypothetical protein